MPGRRTLTPWRLLLVILLAVAVIASGCGGDDTAAEDTSTDGGSANVVFEVVQDGTVIASFLLADVRKLPQQTVKIGSQDQKGPTLSSVLEAAGVEAFDSVAVDGFRPGRMVASELTIASANLNDEVLVVINRRGEAKLVSSAIPPERSIVDIKRLTVK